MSDNLIEDQLNQVQKTLNDTMNETKKYWKEYTTYNKQLQKMQEQTDNREMGGIKISELTESMGKITQFLEGAFEEVGKSVNTLTDDLENCKQEAVKKQKDGNV
jgi:uncharacterized protein YhaN